LLLPPRHRHPPHRLPCLPVWRNFVQISFKFVVDPGRKFLKFLNFRPIR
jgi:hypothetical protein